MSQLIAPLASTRPVIAPLVLEPRSASLRIRGALRIDWAARLSSQLARHGVSVRSLTGRRGTSGWTAELDLTSDSTDLDQLDFAVLLEEPGLAFRPEVLVLTHVSVEPRREHGQSLLLTTEGVDCVGFLAALLHTLAFQSLFPVEIRARTFGNTAVDRIWVRGLGNSAPAPDAAARLERALRSLRVSQR